MMPIAAAQSEFTPTSPVPPPQPPSTVPQRVGSPTVLIVDDNLDVCRPMAILVRHLGYDGRYATGGEAALAAAQQSPPALVILDVMMPGMDGLEVLARLKSDDRTRGVPVVMFSAVSDPEYRDRAVAGGAVDYWVKAAVNFNDLRGRIACLIAADPPPASAH